MILAGIDYSITCPAICIHSTESGPLSYNTVEWYFNQDGLTQKEKKRRQTLILPRIHWDFREPTTTDESRYELLAKGFLITLLVHSVELVVLEGYAMGAKGKVFNIAEATGVLKHLIHSHGIQIYTIPPKQNKKIFTGNGNANKDLMVQTFNQMNGMDISVEFGYPKGLTASPISDMIDSYALIYSYLKEGM